MCLHRRGALSRRGKTRGLPLASLSACSSATSPSSIPCSSASSALSSSLIRSLSLVAATTSSEQEQGLSAGTWSASKSKKSMKAERKVLLLPLSSESKESVSPSLGTITFWQAFSWQKAMWLS